MTIGWAIAFMATAVACLVLLYWVYDGYARFLSLLRMAFSVESSLRHDDPNLPSTVVMLTVHDEVDMIRSRIENLLESDYPSDRFGVLVVSDRSGDGTNEIVAAMAAADPRVHLFVAADSNGKSDAQNRALVTVSEEIVVFTDAGTTFDSGCVRAMNRRFADPRVGMVDAELSFERTESAVARGQGWYWRYERRIRRLESELGLLAVASGACMAVRRSLLDVLHEGVGEDCQIPLMVVGKQYRVVQEPTALAVDSMPSGLGSEIRTRGRMTARNLVGTLAYPRLLVPFLHPGIAFGLWSHKILRWLSPVWLTGLLVCTTAAAFAGGIWVVSVAMPVAVIGLSTLGLAGDRLGLRIPVAGHVWSFVIANLGFAWGIARAISGRTITRYSSG